MRSGRVSRAVFIPTAGGGGSTTQMSITITSKEESIEKVGVTRGSQRVETQVGRPERGTQVL